MNISRMLLSHVSVMIRGYVLLFTLMAAAIFVVSQPPSLFPLLRYDFQSRRHRQERESTIATTPITSSKEEFSVKDMGTHPGPPLSLHWIEWDGDEEVENNDGKTRYYSSLSDPSPLLASSSTFDRIPVGPDKGLQTEQPLTWLKQAILYQQNEIYLRLSVILPREDLDGEFCLFCIRRSRFFHSKTPLDLLSRRKQQGHYYYWSKSTSNDANDLSRDVLFGITFKGRFLRFIAQLDSGNSAVVTERYSQIEAGWMVRAPIIIEAHVNNTHRSLRVQGKLFYSETIVSQKGISSPSSSSSATTTEVVDVTEWPSSAWVFIGTVIPSQYAHREQIQMGYVELWNVNPTLHTSIEKAKHTHQMSSALIAHRLNIESKIIDKTNAAASVVADATIANVRLYNRDMSITLLKKRPFIKDQSARDQSARGHNNVQQNNIGGEDIRDGDDPKGTRIYARISYNKVSLRGSNNNNISSSLDSALCSNGEDHYKRQSPGLVSSTTPPHDHHPLSNEFILQRLSLCVSGIFKNMHPSKEPMNCRKDLHGRLYSLWDISIKEYPVQGIGTRWDTRVETDERCPNDIFVSFLLHSNTPGINNHRIYLLADGWLVAPLSMASSPKDDKSNSKLQQQFYYSSSGGGGGDGSRSSNRNSIIKSYSPLLGTVQQNYAFFPLDASSENPCPEGTYFDNIIYNQCVSGFTWWLIFFAVDAWILTCVICWLVAVFCMAFFGYYKYHYAKLYDNSSNNNSNNNNNNRHREQRGGKSRASTMASKKTLPPRKDVFVNIDLSSPSPSSLSSPLPRSDEEEMTSPLLSHQKDNKQQEPSLRVVTISPPPTMIVDNNDDIIHNATVEPNDVYTHTTTSTTTPAVTSTSNLASVVLPSILSGTNTMTPSNNAATTTTDPNSNSISSSSSSSNNSDATSPVQPSPVITTSQSSSIDKRFILEKQLREGLIHRSNRINNNNNNNNNSNNNANNGYHYSSVR